jgi:hypothetical protein
LQLSFSYPLLDRLKRIREFLAELRLQIVSREMLQVAVLRNAKKLRHQCPRPRVRTQPR